MHIWELSIEKSTDNKGLTIHDIIHSFIEEEAEEFGVLELWSWKVRHRDSYEFLWDWPRSLLRALATSFLWASWNGYVVFLKARWFWVSSYLCHRLQNDSEPSRSSSKLDQQTWGYRCRLQFQPRGEVVSFSFSTSVGYCRACTTLWFRTSPMN